MGKFFVKGIHSLIVTMAISFFSISSASAFDFAMHGYYRMRSVLNDNIDLQQANSLPTSNDRLGFIAYNQMRLRIDPTMKLNDNIAIHGQLDLLDNILFGTSETRELNVHSPVVGTLTLPQGAGSFRLTGGTAGENGAINVRAIWADILSPIGLFRIGRQPSHWGLGIFQNDGRGRQGDFGDTADRLLYLLQYDLGGEAAVSAGLLWDIPFEAGRDPRRDGFQGAVINNGLDTHQWAALVLYDHPIWSVGLFGGFRHRNGREGASTTTVTAADGANASAGLDGNTNLYFGDLYARYQFRQYRLQLEAIYIGGRVTTGVAVDGVAFTGVDAVTNRNAACGTGGIICMPANQPIQVIMAAFEADAEYDFGGEWNFKSGFAQGDLNILSEKITQLGFRPDYQIALLMFNMPLGSSPQVIDATTGNRVAGAVPITGNYINNALYASAGYKHRFDLVRNALRADWFKLGGQATTAFAHQKNVNINFAAVTGGTGLPIVSETASSIFKRWYGVEFDLIGEARFFDMFLAVFEGGVLIPGRAYDINVSLAQPGTVARAIPSDKAELAWIARLSGILEF